MANIKRLSSLILAGLVVEGAAEDDGILVVSARSAAERRPCPLCRLFAGRVHSRYVRTVADLPCAGRKVQLRLTVRRFVCEATSCRRRIFAVAGHPQIAVVSRDRGGGYGEAVTNALPDTVQVADRWHLMENASSAFLDAVRKSMRAVQAVIGAATINPDLLTSAEKLQYEGYLRREEMNAVIARLADDGIPIQEIVRRTGHSRKPVRQVIRGERTDIFRIRQSSLEAHLPMLNEMWNAGCRNGAELWRNLRAKGFRGSLRVVGEWATRRRRAERASDQQLRKVQSARTIAHMMTTARDHLGKSETMTTAAIEAGVPMLVEARSLIDRFQAMIRTKSADDLDAWVTHASKSLVASFASGIMRDRAAVQTAITEPWSNGQTEGRITRLKLVKRQMYGRGKLDLLQARLIGAA